MVVVIVDVGVKMRRHKVWIVSITILVFSISLNFNSVRNFFGHYDLVVPVLTIKGKSDHSNLMLPIKLHPGAKLNDTLSLIHYRLESGMTLSFKQLSDFILWNQEDAFIQEFFLENEAIEENRAFLESQIEVARSRFFSLVPMNLESLSPSEIKIELENSLQDSYNGNPLALNRDKANLLHLLTENQGQDYSMTILYLLVARQMGKLEFDKRNFSVIFTEGRIYPGYVQQDEDARRVFGLDFRREGAGGPVYFGKLRDLSSKIEVVDADHFLMTNLFRGRVANACELRNQIRAKSFKKWGKEGLARVEVNCLKTSEQYLVGEMTKKSYLVQDPLSTSVRSQVRLPLREVGGSIFAFGTTTMLPGQTARLNGSVLKDLSVQYSALDVEPVAELVNTLDQIRAQN